ncbi:MAG: TIGR02453 family protein [Pseudonocardiales bacterium]|nr:MAG: TIGR02453 family protein [Pseudonocardiales bacterium]
MGFSGFPERLLTFYEGLAADNSKAYWTDHKAVYDECVAAPMKALLDALEPEFGEAKFFRPYRDVRFSKDKTPYKTQAAAMVHNADGDGGLYLALSADGLFVGGGYYHTSTDQAQRLRAAVDDDRTGTAVAAMIVTLSKAGWDIGGEHLKRVPKPWDDTHPRAGLLRHKSLVAGRSEQPAAWLHTAKAKDRIAKAWRQLLPLNTWLADNVGGARVARRR